MRSKYVGYYRPTDAEFQQLWKDCVFAFDASALLDIYRSTAATRQVVFAVLEALQERIWIPYQAGYEFQKNRLTVISEELTSYSKVAEFLRALGGQLKSQIHRHSLEVGDDLVKELSALGDSLASRVEQAKLKQPDLVKSDNIRDKITELFTGKIGAKLDSASLTELYKEAEKRYESKTPPGYLDSKKPSPEKFGDFIIWKELLQYSNSQKRNLVFVTADAKEDWWWEHDGKTIGPRPELAQEMMEEAKTQFYMYDLEQFIEVAGKFQELGVTKQVVEHATEELKGIQQTREALADKQQLLRRNLNRVLGGAIKRLQETPAISWNTVPVEVYSSAISEALGRELRGSEKLAITTFLKEPMLSKIVELDVYKNVWDIAEGMLDAFRQANSEKESFFI